MIVSGLNKMRAGQRVESLPAGDWNAFIDAARGRQAEQHNQFIPQLTDADGVTDVLIKNNTGAARGRFEIVGLDAALILPTANLAEFQERIMFTAVTPDDLTHYERVAVLLEPLAEGKIGFARIAGPIPVQIDIDHATNDYVRIKDNDHAKFQSDFAGNGKILWKESGTSVKWGYVMLGVNARQEVKGKVDATITIASGSGTVSVWRNAADSGANVTGYLNWMTGDQDITSGKEVICRWFPDEAKWIIVGADCE